MNVDELFLRDQMLSNKQKFNKQISDEEWAFCAWCEEAFDNGLVKYAHYEIREFTLHDNQRVMLDKTGKRGKKSDDKTLFTNTGSISYTPDFALMLTDKGVVLLRDILPRGVQLGANRQLWIDTKGSGGKSGSNQVFFLKQRMLWDRCGIFVEKVVPDKLFKKTWAPESLRWMEEGARKVPTLNKIGRTCGTIGEFLEKNNWRTEV